MYEILMSLLQKLEFPMLKVYNKWMEEWDFIVALHKLEFPKWKFYNSWMEEWDFNIAFEKARISKVKSENFTINSFVNEILMTLMQNRGPKRYGSQHSDEIKYPYGTQ